MDYSYMVLIDFRCVCFFFDMTSFVHHALHVDVVTEASTGVYRSETAVRRVDMLVHGQ